MKKFLLAISATSLLLTGCIDWDDEVQQNYGAGPSIEVTTGNVTDNSFSLAITPGSGAAYYTYIIDVATEPEEIDASTFIKGGYGSSVYSVADVPSLSGTLNASPNTSYVIYAVACSQEGVVGNVATAVVKTTDGAAAAFGNFEAVPASKAVNVAFSEAVTRGTGAITAIYYKEWDWDNTVSVPSDEITVTIDGRTATLAAPTTPDGAIVLFSWEEGAFIDAVGNKSAALTSTYDEESDDFTGAYVINKKVAFAITDANVAEPASGSAFKDPSQFVGKLDLGFDIFRIDDEVETGDLSVTYTGTRKTTTVKLAADDWAVEGQELIFVLPEGIEVEDVVTLAIKEGVIYDVYGNPNAAFSSDQTWWKYVSISVDDIVGTYNLKYISYWDETKTVLDAGNFTIAANPEADNGLIIRDFLIEGSELKATYDLAAKTLTIASGQILGTIDDTDEETGEKVTYGAVFATATTGGNVFSIDTDNGTITPVSGMWGIYLYDATFSTQVGWYDAAAATLLTKVTDAEAQAKGAKATVKARKVTIKSGDLLNK